MNLFANIALLHLYAINLQEEAAREPGISSADADKLRRAAHVTIVDQRGAASRDQRPD